ncbi:MAG: Ig-like domain-containing protein, partial [Firmicutes bacterium]|nr:Ig-like domain-containing protein [Bacillota bacterium]
KISGWKLNGGVNEDNVLQPYDGRSFLFEAIAPGGAVKDLIIEDFDAYVKEYGLGSEYGNALLTGENNGRISGVTLKDCSLSQLAPQTAPTLNKPELAGIAVTNTGKIEACQVVGLKLQAGRDEQISNLVGCAVALKNHLASEKGEITACYVEGLQTSGSYHHGDGFEDAKAPIIADDMVEQGSGPFTGNYFRTYNAGPETDGPRGTNITAITNDPDKPAFAANLAYHMNHEASELWGIYRPAEAADDGEIVTPKITPLSYGGEDCKAPVMAEFKYGDTDYKTYVYPGPCKLPGNENFGEDLAFWQLGEEGTVVYSIGYEFVDVLTDTLFVGVASPEGCVAELYGEDAGGNKTGITCYKDLNDALAAAAATELENPHLDIVGDCAMDSGTFTVKADMVMTVCDGTVFTLKRPAAINNKGTFTCAEGATFHKRGTMNNTGTINVDGTFWNYGSKLTNSGEGTIKNRTDIKCKPHLMGEWQSATQPNEDGTWTNTATCEVCTNTIEEKVDPNPEADAIDYIEVYRYPTKAEYQTGDNFDTRGLMISAVLKSGLRAKITGYDMTISDGTSEPAVIVDGDVLNKHGAMQITVNYEGFTCSFPIVVRSPITGIAIADGEREVAVNEHIQLETIITPEGVQADVQWTSDNETVATVDENGLVTGHAGGQARITASVDDMSASVTITVHEAATSLELDAYEICIPKDGNGLVAARVAPATADGEVTWTASDPSVAGIIVTDPQTGETSVVDSATTKLSQGNASEASSYIAVAGVGEGQATITASVKDARGLTIHKDCTVDVSQSDSSVRILYDGLVVSGKTVTVDASEETIYMRAESSDENDTIDWNSIDDIADPVISVNDNGTIDLIRSGSAVVQVTSDKTGVSDYCILNVVRMPASITLSTNDLYMAKGTVKMLTATMSPEKVDGSVKWSTSDESVAKVTNGGVITGEGEGVAIITAQSTADPDVMAKCQVTVFERELTMTLDKDTFYYDGKDKVPHITITSGSQILAENITESNDRVMLVFEGSVRGPGKHNVTAIGRDEGMGMATASYMIIIKPTKVRKLVGESKAITVKWKKKKRGVITGYQVQIATDQAFTKNKKTKKIKKAKINNVTFKNLKANKKYYVKMRSYKKIGATSYYSKWSEIETVKTKK